MTHVPCPPVKITPAVFQGCSIIGRAANENNRACGEETKQTRAKGRKTSSWTEIPAAGLEMYTSSEGEPLSSSWRNTAFQGQSQLAISQSSLEALCLQQRGLLGQAQQRCSNAWTYRMWVANRAQICFKFLKYRPFFSLTFYLAITKTNDIKRQMERKDLDF